MPAQLQAISGGSSILLDKPILLLGRDPECDIQLESPKISRRHCCIAQVGDYLVVRDLGSTNGIRINGVRVVEGHLKGGDELTIGNHRYQVRWDAMMAVSVPAGPNKAVIPAGHPVDDPTAGVQEDAVLESCEEPVPIAEPAGAPPADVPRIDSELCQCLRADRRHRAFQSCRRLSCIGFENPRHGKSRNDGADGRTCKTVSHLT